MVGLEGKQRLPGVTQASMTLLWPWGCCWLPADSSREKAESIRELLTVETLGCKEWVEGFQQERL